MRRIQLTEYQTETGVALSLGQINELRSRARIALGPCSVQSGCFDLTPKSWIGSLECEDLSVVIRPKIPIGNVMFLLSYAIDPKRWSDAGFDFKENRSLVEAVIPGFVTNVKKAFRRGIHQGYRSEDDSSSTLRGRLRVDDQIRDRFGLFPPAEVRFDDFTEDIELNRIVKAALSRLSRMRIRSASVRESLRTFESALARVRLVEYTPTSVPKIRFTRLNQHYRAAYDVAKLILRSTSIDLRHGSARSSGFLVDMNVVFEDFVVVALREALGVSARVFPQNAKGRLFVLDEDARVHLEPDISCWEGERCSFVGDVKYKRIKVEGIKHPDLYQLHAYCTAANLPMGLLIYAAGEAEHVSHSVRHAGNELHVMTLDLSGTPDAILEEISTVTDCIIALRKEGMKELQATQES